MSEFSNLDELKSKFSYDADRQRFILEDIQFRFIGINSDGETKTRRYRNEDEQLTLYVQLVKGIVINVLSRYEVGDQWL